MQNTFNHLRPSQQKQLIDVAEQMVNTVNGEKIYCFATRICRVDSWSAFRASHQPDFYFTHDLVMIMPRGEERSKDDIFTVIKTTLKPPFSLNCLIYYFAEAIQYLELGDRFLRTVVRQGMLLYDRHHQPLAYDNTRRTKSINRKQSSKTWAAVKTDAEEALLLAKGYSEKEQYIRAVQVLYSSAMKTIRALLDVHMGYQHSSGHLHDLLALCDGFSNTRDRTFPAHTREEKQLIELMVAIGTMKDTNESPTVTATTCGILLQRIADLNELASLSYKEKMEGMPVG